MIQNQNKPIPPILYHLTNRNGVMVLANLIYTSRRIFTYLKQSYSLINSKDLNVLKPQTSLN